MICCEFGIWEFEGMVMVMVMAMYVCMYVYEIVSFIGAGYCGGV